MRKVWDILWTIGSYSLAVPAGTLPRRWWSRLDVWIPVSRCGSPSGIATVFLAAFVGIPAFFAHLEGNSRRGADMVLQAGSLKPAPGAIPSDEEANAHFMSSYLSPLSFVFTPLGFSRCIWASPVTCAPSLPTSTIRAATPC